MRLLFNYATRSRPRLFRDRIGNIKLMCADADHRFVIKVDEDDETMQEWIVNYCEQNNLELKLGQSKNKIEAINRGIDDLDWDVMVVMSDDMEIVHYGFDKIIERDMPPDLDCLLFYPDQYEKKTVTFAVIGKKYYERDGFVYNTAYNSLWCDNEQTEIAKIRGKLKQVDLQLVQHNHPTLNLANNDALYRRNNTFHEDCAVFRERERHNFYL